MFDKLLKAITGGPAKNNAPVEKGATLSKDKIAELLQTTPEALEAFEKAYAKCSMDIDGALGMNSRQAADMKRPSEPLDGSELRKRIVNELLAQTTSYVFDGELGEVHRPKALPAGTDMVTLEEICALPVDSRPQLSGELMKKDFGGKNYPHLFFFYEMYLNGETPEKRKFGYDHFRQGLDILDLDEISYEIIGMNKNSMGHWLPQLVEACRGQEFFRIPKTTIVKVPLPLLQLTHIEYAELTPATLAVVDDWAYQAFHLDENKEYFIKTGTYSSKFDFRNAYVHDPKEVHELGEYLLFIHFQALQMAGSTCTPCIYGVSTTNEWVVREFIKDKEQNPCIYNGLPLHTEYRVFVDCDSDSVLGITPYWEPDTMTTRFAKQGDPNSPHQMHDYVIYKAHEKTLMNRYFQNKEKVLSHIAEILPSLDLKGQWSIDVMQNGDEFWIIDMALAENSFFYKSCVPEQLRHPTKEQWLPALGEGKETSF